MNSIPNGIVTFLFTDIEGSTKLAQEFHEQLHDVFERHNSILRNAVESNNGFVFKIIGDAFCCAFQNSFDAVKAAVEAQIKLNSENWEETELKVRMGIHSGNAEWSGSDYMGYITLARTSRVMSAAYGGQVLISNDAYTLLINHKETKAQRYLSKDQNSSSLRDLEVSSSFSFRDLGERRLKDVIQPIRLYQILSKGLREDFPPLKTLDARPNNLPIQLTSFIGRENVMQQIKIHLKNSQLVTLLGTGGAGKTRTALQVAADMIDEFENGVFIAELAPVSDPVMVAKTVMDSIGIKEEPGNSLEETIISYLKNKELLLILDNCEHLVLEAAKLSNKLLSKCPKLKIIATTREALNCFGEQIYRVPSLSLPGISEVNTTEQLTQYEAVRLFIERALSVNPNFRVNNENAPALAQICFQLDGIPLAIELAAVRTKLLTLNNICIRLDKRFKLLTGGKRTALPRQQTLKALIDWSYDLLNDHEKKLWSRLSIFSGGWTLEAAEEICSDEKISKDEMLDLLGSLSEKSVIIYDMEKERYGILETIKQYGEEKLNDLNETEDMQSKHLNYFMELSEKAEPNLYGSEAKIWFEKLESEHANFQSAIAYSLKDGVREKGARLAVALENFWNIRGHYSAGRQMLDKILINVQGISKLSLGKLLLISGTLSNNQGAYEKGQKLLEESLTLFRELDDKKYIADSLNGLGLVEYSRGNIELSLKYIQESLALSREMRDKIRTADSLSLLGLVNRNLGNNEQALKYVEEGLILTREIGDKNRIAESLNGLGILIRNLGNNELAQMYLEEGLALSLEIGDKLGIANALISLSHVASNLGNNEQRRKFLEESLAITREMGDLRGAANALYSLGNLAFETGDDKQADMFHKESIFLRKEMGDKRGVALSLNVLGAVAYESGNYEQAKDLCLECLRTGLSLGNKITIANALIIFAGILAARKDFSGAASLSGTIDSLVLSSASNFDKDVKNRKAKITNQLHEELSDEEFEKYFEEGKKKTLQDAANSILNVKW